MGARPVLTTLLRLVSLRRLGGAPLRTLLTVSGIALGVASVVAMTLVNDGVFASVRRGIDAIAGRADLEASAGSTGLAEDVLEQVRAVPGVAHAAPLLERTVSVTGPRRAKGESLLVVGLDTLGDPYFADDPLEGGAKVDVADPIAFLNAPDSLLLSGTMATRLGLRVGDVVEVASAIGVRTLKIRGLLPANGLAAAFGGDVGVMDVLAMQIAFGREGRFDRIQIALAKGEKRSRVRSRLVRALGPGVEVESPRTRADRQQNMLAGLRAGTMIAGAVALLVGMFLIYNTVSIAVVERRREIGTLRALGARSRTVLALFASEAALLGALGGLAGVGLGILLSDQLLVRASESVSALYLRISARDVPVPTWIWALGVVLGAGAALSASIFPARAAAKVDPVETLRRGALGTAGSARLRTRLAAAGAGMLVLALASARLPTIGGLPSGGYVAALFVLLGAAFFVPTALRVLEVPMRWIGGLLFGTPGRLAADNLARAPLRTSVTVAALMTAVAMTVNVACFVDSFRGSIVTWIESAVPADLFVNSSDSFIGVRNTPLDPSLGEELRHIPGVASVDTVRMARVQYGGREAFLLSVDDTVYDEHGHPIYLEGGPTKAPRGRPRSTVALSENFSRRWNLHRGDSITLRTPTGPRRYRVSAVVVDYTSDTGSIVMNRASYVRDFGDRLVDSFDLYLTADGRRRIGDVRREILRRFGRRWDLRVKTNRELRDQILAFVNQMFQIMSAMEVLALLIAILGVANALIASVLDRTREIGVLRAIGASRGQVLRSVLAEAALMGLYASLLGAPTGALLGWLTVRVINTAVSGWAVPFVFAWSAALQTSLIVTVAALVAGILPARSATRVQPIVALRAE